MASAAPQPARIAKKRKFVQDGVMFAEITELLGKELLTPVMIGDKQVEAGFGGAEIRATPTRTEVIIRASQPQAVLGDKGRRIRELQSVISKRFNFPEGSIELYAERLNNRGLSAQAQAESLKYKLLGGLAVRRACYGIMRLVEESGAKGVEVVVRRATLRPASTKSSLRGRRRCVD
jgi:small subunit ribosomal protein S3e